MKQNKNNKTEASDQRVKIEILGLVQGVGFRPFVFNLAHKLKLKGRVQNSSKGVVVEIEGKGERIDQFLVDVRKKKPAIAYIQNFQYVYLDPLGYRDFQIVESQGAQKKQVIISPDLATCPECLKEILDSKNRRHQYPFTNCTLCGPRYSIIEKIPYDRCNTVMKIFPMCVKCQKEYEDPTNRRFHAQPNACPECGPQVELWDKKGKVLKEKNQSLEEAVLHLAEGKVVAIKGLGGFHLMVDATNDKAVALLRKRKNREEKPFALMFPNMEQIKKACILSTKEKMILESSEAPIVLARKRNNPLVKISSQVAFQNPCLGVMLPFTPLHHLLLRQIKRPLVATSGNLSDEPLVIDEKEALRKLSGIADYFLVHNRPIARHVDDSIVRLLNARPLVLRRARGYAPLGIEVKKEIPSIMAYGGHLKNTIALGVKKNIFLSQHIGSLETKESLNTFRKTIEAFKDLYSCKIHSIACDRHPAYLSTQAAQQQEIPILKVQHHHAHIAACMAENHLKEEVLGIAWDGTGWGEDETVWGGEFLLTTYQKFKRVAYFKPFCLPGGDKAVKEPRRTALALLYALYGDNIEDLQSNACLDSFTRKEREIIYQMIQKRINSPKTSSVGRLFDAVSSLLGLTQIINYEGQAAMLLEYAFSGKINKKSYDFNIHEDRAKERMVINWEEMIKKILKDLQRKKSKAEIAIKFHNTLVEMAVAVSKKVKKKNIVLSGGCFQNRYLTERMIFRMKQEGFFVYTHQLVPPNDGCIALGQIMVAGAQKKTEKR